MVWLRKVLARDNSRLTSSDVSLSMVLIFLDLAEWEIVLFMLMVINK